MTSRSDIRDLSLGAVNQTFLVTSPTISETKAGSPYLRATLRDKSGEMRGVKWDTSEVCEPGVYLVRGLVDEHQGSLNVKISSMEPTGEDITDFVRCAPVPADEIEERLDRLLDSLTGEVGEVVRCVFDGAIRQAFLESPAASSNHHAYRGGLAEHTVSMATIAESMALHYNYLYPGSVDRDLLVAGALLHDLGKVRELAMEGPEIEYTIEGMLIGHIAECVTLLHDACMAVLATEETRQRLIHMVLSHHGKLEYGSPVTPRLLEAQLLHLIDMVDSRCAMFREATEGLQLGEMTDWVKPLGGRVVR